MEDQEFIPKWNHTSYGYDSTMKENDYLDLGLNREKVLGIAFFRYLYNITHQQGLSLLILCDGRHRSGKSLFWAFTGSVLDDLFFEKMERRIVYDAETLLSVVKEIDNNKEECPFIIVDESGNTLNAADWYEKVQKSIVKALTIIGYLHPTIVFISTNKSLVLSGVRKQAHLYVFISPTKGRKYSRVTPYEIVWRPLRTEDRPWHKKIKMSIYGRNLVKLCSIRFPLPPQEIVDRYRAIEEKIKPKILNDLIDDVAKNKVKEIKDFFDMQKALTQILMTPSVFGMRKVKTTQRFDSAIIKMRFRIANKDAEALKRMAEQCVNEGMKPGEFFGETDKSANDER